MLNENIFVLFYKASMILCETNLTSNAKMLVKYYVCLSKK